MSLTALRERFFGTPEDLTEREARLQAARDEQARKLLARASWLEAEGTKDLEAQIDRWLDESEVGPGEHAAMLSSVGVRTGLRRVKKHLVDLRLQVRKELGDG